MTAPDLLTGAAAPSSRPRSTLLLPAVTGVLAALGLASVAAAAGFGLLGAPPVVAAPVPPSSATPDATATGSTTPAPVPSATPGAGGSAAVPVGIAGLADPVWVSRTAERTGIPSRALAAYAGAALRTAQVAPGCGVGWNTIAGLGEVETHHGSMNGAHIDDAGVVSPRIVGVPLDGDGTTAVRDTDGGALDGDTVWDRAVGPLQFTPATWAQAGQDGNGDGVRDVDQIDDAALAAALHLCEMGGDLRVGDNWISAVRGYNDNPTYIADVSAAATSYAARASG